MHKILPDNQETPAHTMCEQFWRGTGLTDRQHRQLRHLFGYPGAMQVRAAGALWRCEGPTIAGELLEQLPKYLDDDAFGPEALRILAAMGPHAHPLLRHLEELVSARQRVAVYLGDPDADMRADETLTAATRHALDRIAASSELGPTDDEQD